MGDVYVRTMADTIIAEWVGDLTEDCRLVNTDENHLPTALVTMGWHQLCTTGEIVIAVKENILWAIKLGFDDIDHQLFPLGPMPSWGGRPGEDMCFSMLFADTIFSKMIVANKELTDNAITQVNALQIYNEDNLDFKCIFFVI